MRYLPPVSRRAYIVGITLFIIVILFGYYLLIILPSQEKKLIQQKARALNELSQSFQALWKVYDKNAEQLKIDENKSLEHIEEQIRDKEQALLQNLEESKKKKLNEEIDSLQVLKSSIRNSIKNKNPNLTKFDPNSGDDYFSNVLFSQDKDTLKASVEVFFNKLKIGDSFDDFIVIKNCIPSYQTTPGKLFIEGDTLRCDNENPKVFGEVKNAKLGYHDYKLFSTSFQTDDHTEWIIYALIHSGEFEAEKRKVSPLLLIFISVLLLVIIFATPLLKLVFMSSIEQLNKHDVVFSSLSFIFSTSLIMLVLLALDSYYVDTEKKVRYDLNFLSNAIKTELKGEIDSILQQVDNFNEASLKTENNVNNLYVFDRDKSINKALNTYPYFKNIYWLDPSGLDRFQYSGVIEENYVEPSSYKERPYFSEIDGGKGWLTVADSTEQRFFVQSIYSWYSGENLAVVSKPSGQKKIILTGSNRETDTTQVTTAVVAAAVWLYSVIDPILPTGYEFAIIDETGEVQFHSEKNRNLREDFIAECNHNADLLSAIHGNVAIYTDIEYNNNEYAAYIQPLGNIPWYLITFHNKAYSRSPYAQIMYFTFISIIILGILSALQTFIVSLLYYRPSKLRGAYFSFEWLRPASQNKEKYFAAIVLIVIYIIELILYNAFIHASLIHTIVSFLFAILFAYAFIFAVLKGEDEWKKAFEENKEKNVRAFIWKKATLFIMISIVLSILILATIMILAEEYKTSLIVWVLLFATALLYFFSYKQFLQNDRISSMMNKRNYRVFYVVMLFSYLFISSIFSTIFLFQQSYEQEMLVWKKFALYQIGAIKEERNRNIEEQYKDKKYTNGSDTLSVSLKRKEKGRYYAIELDTLNPEKYIDPDSLSNKNSISTYYEVLFNLRRSFNDLQDANNGFIFPAGDTFIWNSEINEKKNEIHFRYFNNKYPVEKSGKVLQLTACLPAYLQWHFDYGNWIFAGFGLLFLYGLYKTVSFAVRRIFALGFIAKGEVLQYDDKYLEMDIEQRKQNLFVISLPFSGTYKLLASEGQGSFMDTVNKLRKNFRRFSLSQLHDEEEYKGIYTKISKVHNSRVILEHFGYNIENIEVSNRKLKILEKLSLEENTIIIFSGISPVQLIEAYEEPLKKSKDHTERSKYENLINRWRDILSGFVKVYFSPKSKEEINERKHLKEDCTIHDLLEHEFKAYPLYFDSLKNPIMEEVKKIGNIKDKKTKEEIVLKIQSMAQPFYYSLWNTCSRYEKYLLYDLATDNFVNIKNIQDLLRLVEKGLIFYDESLYIMNESFRNFILTTVKKSEALEIEKELNRKGTWRIIQVVIAILVLSLVFFVSFAQESLLNNFIAILTGLAALGPFLLRLGGFFSSGTTSANSV